MSGETKTNISGWSVDTALEHLRALIDGNDKRYEQRFQASEKAVVDALAAQEKQTRASFAASEAAINKADINAEKWRANANEWRAAMMDRENKFASRVETDAKLEAVKAEIAALKESRSTDHGRGAGRQDLWGYIIAGAGLLLTLGALIALGASVLK